MAQKTTAHDVLLPALDTKILTLFLLFDAISFQDLQLALCSTSGPQNKTKPNASCCAQKASLNLCKPFQTLLVYVVGGTVP